MIGEGEYNQDALKDIEVTDSYLGMDQEIRGCQDSEPYYNCTTREYINRIKEKCGCLPLNMRLSAEVILYSFLNISVQNIHFNLFRINYAPQSTLIVSTRKRLTVQNV